MKRLLTTLALLTSLSYTALAQSQQSAPPQKVGPQRTQGIFTEENLLGEFQQVGNTDFFASRAWDYYDLVTESLDAVGIDAQRVMIFDALGQRVSGFDQPGLYIIVEEQAGKKAQRKVYIDR